MGQIGYFRRVQAAIGTMIANSELRWFEELNDAKAGNLTVSKLFRDMSTMTQETFGVWRNLLDLGGSPVLPHVHFEAIAADTLTGVATKLAFLDEPVSDLETVQMTPLTLIGPPAAAGATPLFGCVSFAIPGKNIPAGVDRETIKIDVYAVGYVAPAVGYYTGVVLQGPLPWPFGPGKGTAIATVSVHLS